ncbi:hypothetical protein QBC47DRAFT_301214 [Echria macrotheca]|uniref:Multiple RNA-binding domain-containing protein 1 n=1 Tax=Echria macrotheca TaxID=438768 RepID=A0AAJ0BFQ1_9PEZI|nr:hypothetical protein QBC47DRAFT_301214 [Echria macrotheca]
MAASQKETAEAPGQSSRLFVKNLPPNITEAEFRKHFSSQGRVVTDVKLIPNRRIGFIGYKSHEDAARAVKYFNRSFIRMSRIAVDIAKPIADSVVKPAPGFSLRHDSARLQPATTKPPEAAGQDGSSPKKRKRDEVDEADPKLQEFLEVMGHPLKKPRDNAGDHGRLGPEPEPSVSAVIEAGESDDEYEEIPARTAKIVSREAPPTQGVPDGPEMDVDSPAVLAPDIAATSAPQAAVDGTDDDWLRSKTNRLLDLVDPDDPGFSVRPKKDVIAPEGQTTGVDATELEPPPDAASEVDEAPQTTVSSDPMDLIQKTSRLFLRNLSYNITEDDIRNHFGTFGALEEVSLPVDKQGRSKGFAMIQYADPSSAIAAFQTDGSTFQGRIIHILPAAAKRENKLDEFAISKLPLKKQQIIRKKAEAASNTFNWNSLFMSQDAVNTAISERLGVSKHELLNPTDASAAVKQAVAETTVIQEAKAYFASNGVNIEAFKSQQRGDTSILVKNIGNTTIEELRQLFEEHGTVLRVLMPPSGTIAIVQFAQPAECRTAFARKAYSRFKDSVLFLEKGPKGLFVDTVVAPVDRPAGVQKPSVAELLERDDAEDQADTSSLFVRNLNFSTTSDSLAEAFRALDGFVSAKVKTKTDPKKPGQVLSMGFGFCAFRTKEQAQAALKTMDGFTLDGHKLVVKASHRGNDAAEEQRKQDLAKKAAGQRTKLVIKNLPFEASKKDVRTLFGTYGKLVALRVPKKFDHSSRGFAFAEFSTAKEALNAMNSLRDTHLLGRRLVIDFAEADEVDPEEQIKAMEKKVRGQVNKVALQQLTGRGRTKTNPFWSVLAGCGHEAGVAGVAGCRSRPCLDDFSFPCVPTGAIPPDAANLAVKTVSRALLHVGSGSLLVSSRRPLLPFSCAGRNPTGVIGNGARQPLGESTGNAQHHYYHQRRGQQHHQTGDTLMTTPTPPAPSILTPLPILPTQSSLVESFSKGPTPERYDGGQLQLHARRKRAAAEDVNPLWLYWTEFQNYRKKQDEKDDKTQQKWPLVLENAFLDAMLAIPHIGRKKYNVRRSLFGRNMLVAEYLWLAYCDTLPPGVEPDPINKRDRKQVSSHIQVLKGNLKKYKCCHIILPKETRKPKHDNPPELPSLKQHDVLVALSEGCFPDKRPNYKYFRRILALDQQIMIRPKQCWIFVSHKGARVHEDGSGFIPATGERLARDQYPHMERNLGRDKWPKEEQKISEGAGAILHEFAKDFDQVESSSIRDLSCEWRYQFPELHQKLDALITANTERDILTAEAECDIFHMQVMLELPEKRGFPANSDLNSCVTIDIEKPHMLNHRWRVDTKLVRPAELADAGDQSSPQLVYETSAEIPVRSQHSPGVMVPFPANVWASMLSHCAEFPAHPFTETAPRGSKKARLTRQDGEADKETVDGSNQHQPTQMDLIPQIAMMQEIYSCPPDNVQGGDGGSWGNEGWARRAMILWTFSTLHSIDSNGQLVTAERGRTSWRFLTVLDPVSEYHLQNSLISCDRANNRRMHFPALQPTNRHAVMSPNVAYQQHRQATMSENFSTAWPATDGVSSLSTLAVPAYEAVLSHSTAPPASTGYAMLGGYGGLTTPPPTACLPDSFSHSFDVSSTGTDAISEYMTAGVSAADMVCGSQVLSDSIPSYASSSIHTSYGDDHWIDAGSWQPGYATAGGGNPHGANIGWHPSSQGVDLKDVGAEMQQSQAQSWPATTADVAETYDRSWGWAGSVSSSPGNTDEDVSREWEGADMRMASGNRSELSRRQPGGFDEVEANPDEVLQNSSFQSKKRGRSDSLDEASRKHYRVSSMPKLER